MDFERLPVLKRTKHSSTVYLTQVQMSPIMSPSAAIPCTSNLTAAPETGALSQTDTDYLITTKKERRISRVFENTSLDDAKTLSL